MSNTKHHTELNQLENGEEIPTNSISAGEIVIGTIRGINDTGQALVDFSANLNSDPIPAISTISVNPKLFGREVALLFSEGDLNNPVIMGIIQNPLHEMLKNFELSPKAEQSPGKKSTAANSTVTDEEILIDGKRLVIEGKEEIVLKCGESSITLTKSGKILIRGKYLLNRSTGVNRIMGGSVQVN